jgi:hypothetical protein
LLDFKKLWKAQRKIFKKNCFENFKRYTYVCIIDLSKKMIMHKRSVKKYRSSTFLLACLSRWLEADKWYVCRWTIFSYLLWVVTFEKNRNTDSAIRNYFVAKIRVKKSVGDFLGQRVSYPLRSQSQKECQCYKIFFFVIFGEYLHL